MSASMLTPSSSSLRREMATDARALPVGGAVKPQDLDSHEGPTSASRRLRSRVRLRPVLEDHAKITTTMRDLQHESRADTAFMWPRSRSASTLTVLARSVERLWVARVGCPLGASD